MKLAEPIFTGGNMKLKRFEVVAFGVAACLAVAMLAFSPQSQKATPPVVVQTQTVLHPTEVQPIIKPFTNGKGELVTATGPLFPSTVANDATVGSIAWTNPGNVTADDASDATIVNNDSISQYIKATNFGFSLAATEVIDGIEVTVNRKCTGGCQDNSIKLVKGGTIGGTDNSAAASWTGSYASNTVGSSSDLWGQTWLYSDINDSSFGVAFSSVMSDVIDTASIDFITITVYHHTGSLPDGFIQKRNYHAKQRNQSMWDLRQSTASQEIPLGQFVDSTDGATPETALSIANTDIKLFKTGATSFANKNSGGATHFASGNYYATLDATDTDTIGPMWVYVEVSGALPVWLYCRVLDEAVFDVQYGTTAPSTLGGTAQTGDAYAIVNSGTHGNAALKTLIDTVDTVVDAILVDTGTTLDGKIDTIDTVVDSILVDTAEIGAAGAGLTAVPWNAAWDAEVQSEVDDALVAQNLDHLVKIAVDTNFATTVHLDSVIGQLADNGTSATYDRTTDSLEAARDNIGTAGAGLTVDSNTIPNGTGTATAGAATTITLQTALGADDRAIGCEIHLTGGTGSGQCRSITDYVNGTLVATVNRPWTTNPDNTTTYAVCYADSAVETVCNLGVAVTSSAGTEVRYSAWLERNGQAVTSYAASASCTVTVRENGSGSDLFSITDSAVNAQGIFELTQATPGFTSDRLYVASAAITEGGNVFTTRHPTPIFG